MCQSTIDDVEALRKRHEDFTNGLRGQDEKLKALDELADRLIREGHPDSALCVKLTHSFTVALLSMSSSSCHFRHCRHSKL